MELINTTMTKHLHLNSLICSTAQQYWQQCTLRTAPEAEPRPRPHFACIHVCNTVIVRHYCISLHPSTLYGTNISPHKYYYFISLQQSVSKKLVILSGLHKLCVLERSKFRDSFHEFLHCTIDYLFSIYTTENVLYVIQSRCKVLFDIAVVGGGRGRGFISPKPTNRVR